MRCKIQSTVFRKISFLSQQKPSKPSLMPTKNHLKRQCNWPMDCYLTSFMESTSGIRWETEGGVPLSVRARMQSCIQYINYSVKKTCWCLPNGLRHQIWEGDLTRWGGPAEGGDPTGLRALIRPEGAAVAADGSGRRWQGGGSALTVRRSGQIARDGEGAGARRALARGDPGDAAGAWRRRHTEQPLLWIQIKRGWEKERKIQIPTNEKSGRG